VAGLDFEQVVNVHHAPLYRFALSLTGDEAAAGDLVQQTFFLWATRGHQLRDESKLRPWLLTTLHREFLGERRHEIRFPHFEVSDVADELPPINPELINQLDGHAVMEALQQVDESYRAALALFYLEDLSYLEIAQALDVPTGTVMSRLSRGKAQLRELLCIDSDERRQKFSSLKATVADGKYHHHG
jgi:RNA polymerase sigma-70 factor (ECF subfamily)